VTQGPHRPTDPKRLTVVGATDLERTLLQAARRERPSPELTKRMAAGLGISAVVGTTAAAVPAAAVTAAAAKTSFGLWVSGGVLAAAVAAGVVGVRMSAPKPAARPADRPAPAAVATPVEAPAIEAAAPTPAIAADRRIERAHRRVQPTAPALPAADLRDQIALIDAARGAVKSGATDRALALLRRYDSSFPSGAFRPEALALRIEALDQGGRGAEAQALAREFLARYPQSPVADRVARVAQK